MSRLHPHLIVGLMSGTSLDGIDAVLLRVRGNGTATRFAPVAYAEYPFPRGLKEKLLRNSVPATSRVDDIARLNMLLAELYADAVRHLARKARIPLSRIDLIGSHGQTIHHLPQPQKMFGKEVRATLQIGDPSALAALTGIRTVGDFRVADIALGGQGAPLVPYFDWLVFRSETTYRILLNIGGIANITVLPRLCAVRDVVAFDTGPGNMVVDALMRKFYKQPFDRDGGVASRGTVLPNLLRFLARHPYLKLKPPKSTGREAFGDEFVDDLLAHARRQRPEDILATASTFTTFCVHNAIMRFVRLPARINELIVSGGGARNGFFMRELSRLFPRASVRTADAFGVPSDAKEAICFAILANEAVAGHPTNIPGVTGAKRQVVLGKVCG